MLSTSSILTPTVRPTASATLTMAPSPGERLIYAFGVVIEPLEGVDGFLSPSDGVLNGAVYKSTIKEYGDNAPSFTQVFH